MSEQRGETSTAGTLLVLVLLLGGLALLGIVVVVGLGFIVARTTAHREMNVAMAEREEAMRFRDLAEMQRQRALAAEQERRRQLQDEAEPVPGQPAQPLQLDQMAKALEVATKYLELVRATQLKEAGELLTAELLTESQGRGALPLANTPRSVKMPVCTGVRASAQAYRFRFRAELPDDDAIAFAITLVPQGDTFRIKATQVENTAVIGGAPGVPNP